MIRGWHGLLGTFTGVALITVSVLPLAALAVWALARRRRVAGVAHAWRMSLAEVGIVYGTAPWIWMTMLPSRRGRGSGRAHDPGTPISRPWRGRSVPTVAPAARLRRSSPRRRWAWPA